MSDEYLEKEDQHSDYKPVDAKKEGVKHQLTGMYQNWFLDYASYVILERAVPHINDGLKPVQRRILHSMKRLDDGRYNKVANIVGHTMQFHPHGDASIGDALVQLGQKDLLIAVRVELHGVSHNVGHLVVASVVQSLHAMEDTSLYGLESVVDVRYGTFQNHIRCIVQKPVLIHAGKLVFYPFFLGVYRFIIGVLVFFFKVFVAHIYLNSLMFS